MSDIRMGGEDDIVREFLAPLAAGFPGAFGLQDDCAVIAPPPGFELVVKTDPVVAGVHFLADADPADIAWRALAVNISDLAAKGAEPMAYLMALALPDAPQRRWLTQFAAGLAQAQDSFGCHLIGGDTDRTPGPLTVSITAFGRVPQGTMLRRGTARPGDQLVATGTLGDAALGLALVKQPGLQAQLALSNDHAAAAIARFARPQPRLALAGLLRGHASAGMDLSDGLAKDCGRMCRASGTAARIVAADLPLSEGMRQAVKTDAAWLRSALTGGDDYEILAAMPLDSLTAFIAAAALLDVRVTRIGEIIEGEGVTIEQADGTPMVIDRAGWDHFG